MIQNNFSEQMNFIRKVLKKIPIFSRLNKEEQNILASAMKLKCFKKGIKIIKANDKFVWFGIIWKGSAIVYANKLSNKHVLKPGDCIGSEALVFDDESASESTIKCAQDTKLLRISQTEFSKLFANRLSFNWKRSVSNDSMSDLLDDRMSDIDLQIKERRDAKAETFTEVSISQQQARAKSSAFKTAQLCEWLVNQLKKNILFKSLGEQLLHSIIEQLYCIDVAVGNTLIKQGEMGHILYIVEKGSIHVFVDDNPQPVTTMTRGDCVGELSLMFDSPRAATCKTMTDCKLWCIDRNDFKITLRREAEKELNNERQAIIEFLNCVPVLKILCDSERSNIAECIKVIACKQKDVIFAEGDECTADSKLYMVKKGKVVAYKNINGRQLVVKQYASKEYFGERALLTNEPRTCTFKAVTDCEFYVLSLSKFIILKNYEKIVTQLSKHSKRETYSMNSQNNQQNNRRMQRSLSDYKIIRGIGEGSFATVSLVMDRFNKQTFAMKRMSKRGIEETQQQMHVSNERKILSSLNCMFIIKLFCTFQDELNVYMVLDLGLGGDMFTYMASRRRLSQEKARFFMGCVVLAFEYLHLRGIVYRDLKPENLVFDFRGYLKLCDFGFGKRLNPLQKTYTVCGTPVYLAPEVIIGKGHSFPVDWWTSGIFLYEMVTGFAPFERKNLSNTTNAIINEQPNYKLKCLSNAPHIVDLLKGLLKKRPDRRYGYSVIDVDLRIKNHKWFCDFDWNKLGRGQLLSPYRPKLKNDYDMKYFDQNPDLHQRKHGKPKRPNASWLQGF